MVLPLSAVPAPELLALRGPQANQTLPAEGAESEESSGEVDGEAESWNLADVRELHPGLLAHRAARTRDLPALAAALAHGAEVNWADVEDEGKTPLVQAVLGVSGCCPSRRAGGAARGVSRLDVSPGACSPGFLDCVRVSSAKRSGCEPKRQPGPRAPASRHAPRPYRVSLRFRRPTCPAPGPPRHGPLPPARSACS